MMSLYFFIRCYLPYSSLKIVIQSEAKDLGYIHFMPSRFFVANAPLNDKRG